MTNDEIKQFVAEQYKFKDFKSIIWAVALGQLSLDNFDIIINQLLKVKDNL